MGRIDDPYEAAKSVWAPDSSGVSDLLLRSFGPVSIPIALLNEVRSFFAAGQVEARLIALTDALNEKVNILEGRFNATEKEELQRRSRTGEFQAAFREAGLCTLFATDGHRVARMGAALGGGLVSDEWDSTAPDLRNVVRTFADLTDEDVACLRIIEGVFADTVRHRPNLNDQNAFSEKMADLRKAVDSSHIHPDDFYSTCRRLEGFGLVMEVVRNTSRMSLDEYCFRPTRRGLRLLALLGKETRSDQR